MTDSITTPAKALKFAEKLDEAATWQGDWKHLAADTIRALASRIPAPDGDVVERVARAIAGVDRCALPHETLCPSPNGCMCRMRACAAIAAMPDQSAEVHRLTAEMDRLQAALTALLDGMAKLGKPVLSKVRRLKR